MDAIELPMKVVLSIDSIKFPLTGIGRYTFELAKQLGKLNQIQNLYFQIGHHIVQEIPEALQSPDSTARFRATKVGQAITKNPLVVEAYRFAGSLSKQFALRNYSDCVFHGPNFCVPNLSGPTVCTIHDLSIFTWAHCHPKERVMFMRKEIEHTLKRADMLITDSEYNRQELAEYFSYPLERIQAVPLACSADFRPRPAEEIELVLNAFGLTSGGYGLFVGTIEPRKNLEGLLDAYAMLPINIRRQWPLVVIGHRGWRSEELHKRINQAEEEGWVRYLGFVTSVELPIIFSGARLFVFPSLYEGFGLPVLEAMASGVPVVCSNASSLPEVAADAAAMCEPTDVDALCSLIKVGLEDATWRAMAIRKGLARSSSYSWKRCAEETVGVYQTAISNTR